MYAASWSGGKDGCLACWEAIGQGYEVRILLNTISQRYQRVRFHGLPAGLLKAQAEAIGLELLQWPTPDDTYEEAFRDALRVLVDRGVQGVVFGDIYPEENRDWCRRMCASVGLEAIHPIFDLPVAEVMARFLGAGFEARVVSGRPDYFNGEQMGAHLGPEFRSWCEAQPGLDICGEKGEFHTVVVDGPLFKQRLELLETEPCQIKGHWFLDIRTWELRNK